MLFKAQLQPKWFCFSFLSFKRSCAFVSFKNFKFNWCSATAVNLLLCWGEFNTSSNTDPWSHSSGSIQMLSCVEHRWVEMPLLLLYNFSLPAIKLILYSFIWFLVWFSYYFSIVSASAECPSREVDAANLPELLSLFEEVFLHPTNEV